MKISDYLGDFLKSGDIYKNDKIILHSDITKLFKDLKKKKFIFTLNDIADFFIEYIGVKGTLIIPTFNFNFCKGESYSIKETPSQMGVLSEVFRVKAKKNRSWHPVYSFAVFGSLPSDYLAKKNYSAYSKQSLFHWLTLSKGKICIINLPDQKSMTYYHYVEECLKVNWRHEKIFEGKYINFDNTSKRVKAKIFVRNINQGVITDVNEMEKILWSKNFYVSRMKSKYDCRSISVVSLYKEVTDIILKDKAKGVLYKIKK